jgi:hypothetical protein
MQSADCLEEKRIFKSSHCKKNIESVATATGVQKCNGC